MIDSFFFGTDPQRLFGTYHAPSGAAPPRSRGVLMIPPLGHEYIQCDFGYRMLAITLSESGFPVLRVECRGCGNAAGSYDDLVLDDWLVDIDHAIEELARVAGVSVVSLAGIRLGATLSALAAGTSLAVDSALLWDPVVDGMRYMSELKDLHAAFVKALPSAHALEGNEAGIEVLGFLLGERLVQDIERIEPTGLGRALATKQVLLLEDGQAPTSAEERRSISARCGSFVHCEVVANEQWLNKPHNTMLPGAAIAEIATWLERLC
jgi:uncharacterized protein